MLISRVPEEGAGEGRDVPMEDDSHEYQTASELFEIIAKNHVFNPTNDPLANSDLVILYKNIDLGTRLMADETELKTSPRSNQRVETVVHSGLEVESDSDAEDVLSSHDLAAKDMFLINEERIDLLNNPPSLENTLCHKFGDLEIKMSNLGTDILFKTATVKEQLDNLKLMSSSNTLNNSVLPSSLLDYICCKRLEDNYNFYMENIIRYVKHTIDQLKRISNGDYLTDKAKEKWREIAEDNGTADSNKKILAASTSIPLHVERKRTGRTTTWDDIVHSEMDIRYLSKIMEKKIFLEVPKIICGSYRLFSKQCSDNLIICCEKKTRKKVDRKDSRVDVVLKLKRSESGHVISNINSIMILQAPQSLSNGPIIALPASGNEDNKSTEDKIVELDNETEDIANETEDIANDTEDIANDTEHITEYINEDPQNDDLDAIREYEEALSFNIDKNPFASGSGSPLEISDSSVCPRDASIHRIGSYSHYQEASFATTPDELSLSMQRLDIQSSLPEESVEEDFQGNQVTKKRSATKVRIKSPYENKSHLIDEKKRKKLLEIRERREKKKMALSESCKIMKNKHAKGALTPQASSSVTKLSITNKSFYNSIYGQTAAIDSKLKSKLRKGRKESDADMSEEQCNGEADVTLQSVEKSKQYLSKNYYLDEAETEMMLYMQTKGDDLSPSTSSALDSAELAANLSLLSQQIVSSVADFAEKEQRPASPEPDPHPGSGERSRHSPARSPSPCCFQETLMEHLIARKSDHDIVPQNSPNRNAPEEKHDEDITEVISTAECRKSIEKLYGLLNKIGKPDSAERSSKVFSSLQSYAADVTTFRESSMVQGSDSGTSLKHHRSSSETSNFSFNKPNITNASTMYETPTTQQVADVAANVVPKVIISTKCQTAKADPEKPKKDHKKVAFTAPKVIPDNPLKAISQLLHEFDYAQKSRHKNSEERPTKPKKEVASERTTRQSSAKGRSRLDQHLKVADTATKNIVITVPRDRGQPRATETRPAAIHDKYDRLAKKKMSEIIDEVKEARGEAVRGPPKSSRLNTLAQPKKSYVQAHSEQYQTRYGRNLMADRLQRLADRHGTPGVDRHGTPGVERHGNPGVERHGNPGVERHGNPGVDRHGTPGVERHGNPGVDRHGNPGVDRHGNPGVERHGNPGVDRHGNPWVDRHGHPAADRHGIPGVDRHGTPGVDRHGAPGADRHGALGPRARLRRADPAPAPVAKQPAPPPIECAGRVRRSASSSPASKRSPESKRPSDAATKHSHAADVPTIKEKMVAVESYVKSHYGRAGSPHSSEQRVVRKCRVPLLPSDIDLASMTSSPPNEESTAIGSELHNLIDSMMKNAPALSALSEVMEEKSKSTDQASVDESLTKTEDRLMHFDSDLSDIFKDNIQTAVEEYQDITESIVIEKPEMKHDIRQFSSSSELRRLENALYSQMSIGNFQKRLRIKNLTITPKQSMQLVVGVQSGDVGSVMVKTSLSQDFELRKCSFTNNISELQKTMPILTNPNADWCRSSMPMQVSTVGYAFPKYHSLNKDPQLKKVITSLMPKIQDERRKKPDENENTKSNESCSKKDYTCQTFKGHLSNLTLGCYSHSIETKEMSCGNEIPVVFKNKASISEAQTDLQEKHIIWQDDKKINKTINTILSPENKENKIANVEKATQEDIEYTTSLDMLVGLLNEIQKITQTQVLNLTNDNVECRQLETILNNAATLENSAMDSNGIITITALDTSRMLDSSPSSYSFYITRSEERELKERQVVNKGLDDDDVLRKEKPTYVDKEVNAIVPSIEYNNTCTDTPSGFFPVTVNTSTSVTSSLIGILADPSTQSMFTCRDTLYSETLNCNQSNILEVTDAVNNCDSFEVTPEKIEEVVTEIDEVPQFNAALTLSPMIEKIETIDVRKKSKQVRKMQWSKSKYEFDPLLKMKRDILVTVYSVLVLTVFAALSFPDVLYRA